MLPDSESPWRPGRFILVLYGTLSGQPGFRPKPGGLTASAGPADAPRARAGRRRRPGGIVPRTRQIRVLRRLPRDQPRGRSSLWI